MKSITTRKEQKDLALSREARGHGDKLERKAEAAIVALLSHPTIPEAAKAAGVSQTTLWRWLQREDFQGKFREAQNKVFDGALGSLQGASADAVQCLRRNLNCGNPPSEIAAARAILDFTMRARELIELTERVSSLEGVLSRLQR
jgi:DNA-binding MurR/RpiR family transcriptional regulator